MKRYTSSAIDVTFDSQRCIHAARCLNGLPQVFDRQRRPWVDPSQAQEEMVAAVIRTCPSGALHYERKDGGTAELADLHNTISVQENGPLYLRGRLHVTVPDRGLAFEETRLALCRCGSSQNKPFCDNSHITCEFSDSGLVQSFIPMEAPSPSAGSLEILAETNGPLRVFGVFTLYDSSGRPCCRSDVAAFCRCGGSARKPFCDNSHRTNGFSTE